MAEEFNLIAEMRDDQGKGASRRLRKKGKVPAVIYGAGRKPRSIMFDHNKVIKELESESFYSSVLNVQVGEKSRAVIVKDIQRHPSKKIIMHIDLQRIVEDEKIRMQVPIHLIGEDEAIGVKQGGGTVTRLMTEIEIICLPKDLPEYFEVDISNLDLDEMLYVSDIPFTEGVELPEATLELNQAIVSIHVIHEEIIEEEPIEGEDEIEGDIEGEDLDEDEKASDTEDDKDTEASDKETKDEKNKEE